ncbi:signal peptidase I [[Limnothrix rosea] IAM M-220]|nr:signal peptidase I [[Limnothrix rosea] IAM M-220]
MPESLVIAVIASLWQIFTKAGKPGWAALIPIYNVYVMLQIVEKPAWWLVLFIVPIVNIVMIVLLPFWLADKFGKGLGYGFGLLLLPYIFYPVLGFGDARYRGTLTDGNY